MNVKKEAKGCHVRLHSVEGWTVFHPASSKLLMLMSEVHRTGVK